MEVKFNDKVVKHIVFNNRECNDFMFLNNAGNVVKWERDTLTVEVQPVYGADYTFIKNDDGYYVPENGGKQGNKHRTAALLKICFKNNSNERKYNLKLEVINYAESIHDFGIFSKFGKALATDYTTDDSTLVKKSFSGSQSSASQIVNYGDIPFGETFIYAKYRKDGSTDSNLDTCNFKILISPEPEPLTDLSFFIKPTGPEGIVFSVPSNAITECLQVYDDDDISEPYKIGVEEDLINGGYAEDYFVAFSYGKNPLTQLVTPLLYKTGWQEGNDDYDRNKYDPKDMFFYYGTTEVDGKIYDEWHNIQEYAPGDNEPIYETHSTILTNRIVLQ